MKWRNHGANPEKIFDQFNINQPAEIIDFSTNTNVVEHAGFDIDYKELLKSYPDDECLRLRDVISKKHDVKSSEVLVTNGANEAFYLIANSLRNKKVGILEPTYSEYRRALMGMECEIIELYSLNNIKNLDALFICNPNNPTGTYLEMDDLNALFAQNPNILFIIDCSYLEFMERSIELRLHENVIFVFSLTKTFHLSGIRLGYLLGDEGLVNKLNQMKPTWSVNSIALRLGELYLNDVSFIEKTKFFYKNERARLINEVKDLGFKVKETHVNYFLMRVSNDEELIKFLLRKGIIVRHTRNFKSLDGKYVRIAVKKREENNRLIEALGEYQNETLFN